MNKTIIEVMGSLSTKYGGVEDFMVNLIRNNPNFKFHLIYDRMPYSERYLEDLKSAGAFVHTIDTSHNRYFINYLIFRKLIKSLEPEIVHFHFGSSDAIWAPLCRRSGVSKLYKTVHSCLYYNGKQASNISEVGILHRLLVQGGRLYKRFDRIFCVSEFVYKQFIAVYGDFNNTETAYLGTSEKQKLDSDGIALLKEELKISNEQKVILSVLFGVHIKGCDILLRALPYIHENSVLVLIGMNESLEYTSQMHSLALSLGVEDRVRWIGFTDDVNMYMSIADIYVQPSRTEALSLAAVEAMSFNLPIVATNTGGLPEVASKLFEIEDYPDLAKTVDSLLESEEDCIRLGDESYQKWLNFHRIENCVKRYSEEYCG